MSGQSPGDEPVSNGAGVSDTPAPQARLRPSDPLRELCKVLRQLLRHLRDESRKGKAESISCKADDILWVVEWWKEHLDGLVMHCGGATDVEVEWTECLKLMAQATATVGVLAAYEQQPDDPAVAEAEYNTLRPLVTSVYLLVLKRVGGTEVVKGGEVSRAEETVSAATP